MELYKVLLCQKVIKAEGGTIPMAVRCLFDRFLPVVRREFSNLSVKHDKRKPFHSYNEKAEKPEILRGPKRDVAICSHVRIVIF